MIRETCLRQTVHCLFNTQCSSLQALGYLKGLENESLARRVFKEVPQDVTSASCLNIRGADKPKGERRLQGQLWPRQLIHRELPADRKHFTLQRTQWSWDCVSNSIAPIRRVKQIPQGVAEGLCGGW